jgi:nicotinate-nucleotide pyrophosphorylase (carboxylating)
MRSKFHEFLREDLGSGDITSELTIPAGTKAWGRIVCKEPCILAGAEEACTIFEELGVRVVSRRRDGSKLKKGDTVLEVSGSARSILAGERLALNMIMRMSGIATLTRTLVDKCRKINPEVRVSATRKTTPGFREFEKKAVLIGGGDPHRMGLYDSVLIKNNHIRLAGGVKKALERAKKGSFTKKVEVEVETPEQAFDALEGGADIIMLDNFKPREAQRLSKELKKRRTGVLVEASGGIRPDNVEKYASAADIISLGWLTHSVRSIDFSMTIEKA